MTLPRYGEYKDSVVEWLGKVPRHWKTGKIHLFARLESGHTPSRQHPEYWQDCTIPWFSLADVWQIRDGGAMYVHETSELVSELGLANSSARLLPKGTVILSRTASVGFSAIMARDMATTQDFANWVCGPDLRPEYLLYGFRAMKGEFDRLMMGSTHQTIYMPDIAKLALAVSPLPEQDAIIVFLDRETGTIDALVAEQEKLIALLKEKRQAVISHAVTKGLDPAAPMKDTGIEWLGEVPAHWVITKLKHIILDIVQGWSPEALDCLAADGEWGVLKAGCVNYGVFRDTEHKALPPGVEPPPGLEVLPGDVLMSRASGSTDLIGSVALVERCTYRVILSDKIFRLEADVSKCCKPFLVRMLGSLTLRAQIAQAISGAEGLANNIGKAAIRAFWVAVPPIEEQAAIAGFLDTETAKLDALTVEAQRAIDLLKERRTALISAAVTGKIDVRGLVDVREAA